MSEPVDHRGYPTKSRQLGKLSWFYEQPSGIHILIQPNDGVDAVGTIVPWRKLCAAVDRYRKLKSAK